MRFVHLFLGILALAVAACGGDDGSVGTLKVAMTDGPFPATAGCLAAALVRVEAIEARQAGAGDAFRSISLRPEATVDIDLLDLRNGLSVDVAAETLPTGSYDQVRIVISQATLQFVDGTTRDFKVPSGTTSGIKIEIKPAIVVAANQISPLLLDVDLARSFHATGNGGDPTCDDLQDAQGKVIFRPLVRAVNSDLSGVLAGTVDDGNGLPVADAEVTILVAGAAAGTEPAAGTLTSPAGLANTAAGSYAVHVDPGTYDVWVRPQGTDLAFRALTGAQVESGKVTTSLGITLP